MLGFGSMVNVFSLPLLGGFFLEGGGEGGQQCTFLVCMHVI